MTEYEADGLNAAIAELNGLRHNLDDAMTTIAGMEHMEPRTKLYAIKELLAMDVTIKERVRHLEGRR